MGIQKDLKEIAQYSQRNLGDLREAVGINATTLAQKWAAEMPTTL